MPAKKDEKENLLGITAKKDADFSEWYQQVLLKSEFVDYSSVSGCIVLRPAAYAVWEKIQSYVDIRLKKMGIKNAYFPLFIPESLLKKEATHLTGFSPEVAWVDYGGNTKLGERLAVRPTSETIMYDSYSKWIRSWRDLPLRLNQWNNVVRWEFKNPVPFIRTREFLWNEGHTAFATKPEAEKEIKDIMNLWVDTCENVLALAGIHGKKTEKEKFAGAEYTHALEFVTPNGRLVQGPDAHHDGQIFAKAFNLKFVDKDEKEKYVYQNTWAITTRMIGVMIMAHSDDKGLVLPPKVAPVQIAIVPILFDATKDKVVAECSKLKKELEKEFSVIIDDREGYTPGRKFNEWELKGVPIRIEFGPKDLEKSQAVLVRRDSGEKKTVKLSDVKKEVEKELEAMQISLLEKSRKMLKDSTVNAKTFDELKKAIDSKKIVRAMWCSDSTCEDEIKDKTGGAKLVAIPVDEKPSGKCVYCGKKAEHEVYVSKSY